MTIDEYQAHLLKAYAALRVINSIPVERMLDMYARHEAIGPMLDPTAFRAKAGAMREDRDVLVALRPAIELGRRLMAQGGEEST
jgi:hypothetical protein